jgi:RNA polymerase sigma factor (TIGR02999 family)
MSKVTRILSAVQCGEPRPAEELLPLVYGELRRLAAQKLTLEKPGQTLQATALVHEAWLRLVREEDRNWNGSRHFFNAAAEAMRRILIDNARRKRSFKRGGDLKRADLNEFDLPVSAPPEELLEINEALEHLEQVHPEEAQLVKLRYFVGMTLEEAAELMQVSTRTADRMWAFAKAWLQRSLQNDMSERS